MSSKHALSVSLTERLCAFIKQEVASGRYSTASEVVRAALRQLEAESSTSPSKSKALDNNVAQAPVSALAGTRRSAP